MVGLFGNPGNAIPTSTFSYEIFDPTNNPIETVSSGILFTPTAGGFASISVESDQTLINSDAVSFSFTMRPQNVLDSSAIIKITLPAQLSIDTNGRLSAGTVNVINVGSA